MAIDDVTFYPGANIGSLWDLIRTQVLINTVLKFVKVGDSTVYKYLRIYDFNSQTGWEGFTVEVIAVGGSASNDDQFFLEIAIAGPTGPTGDGGSSGTSGSSGNTGTPGSSGTSGSSGTRGTSGTSGSSGNTGSPGSSGTSGTSGSSGNTGSPGSSGTSGSSGTRGTSGSSGTSGTSGSSGNTGTPGSSGTSGSSGTRGTSGTSGTSGLQGTSGTSGSSGLLGNVSPNYGYPIVYLPDGNYSYCENMFQYNGGGVVFNGQPDSVSGRTELSYGVVPFYGTDYVIGSLTPIAQNRGEGRIQDLITSGTLDAGKLCYMTTTAGGSPYTETTRMAYADADGSGSATGLLAICLSASSGNDQIRPFALDGYVSVQSSFIDNKAGLGTDDNGKPVYVSPTAGYLDMNAPTGSGQIVRIVGHVMATNVAFYTIYFRPDNTWIEL
jgi:hypothetical protein